MPASIHPVERLIWVMVQAQREAMIRPWVTSRSDLIKVRPRNRMSATSFMIATRVRMLRTKTFAWLGMPLTQKHSKTVPQPQKFPWVG